MAVDLQFSSPKVQEKVVIVYALLGAVLLLMAVCLMSSISASDRRRH